MADELCQNCLAPRTPGYAACKFCKTPFVQNTQTDAIPCPRCNTLNEMGAQRCVACQAWVVVQCVFCHALSPHNVPACQKCGEAFAGAPERFAAQQRQQHLQQGLQVAGVVGNVAASFLGAAAGAGVFSHHERPYVVGYGPPEPYPPAPPPDFDPGTGAGIAQSNESSGGGFFSSLFGGGDSSTGAGIAQSNDSGGGFIDSLLGGSSDDGSTGAGIASSDDANDDGGDFDGNDDGS